MFARRRQAWAAVAVAFLLGACTASPYPTTGGVPHGAGRPYQVDGVWYVPRHDPGYAAVGRASWYGEPYHGRRTASGQIFDMYAFTAAHPTLPFGTRVRVTNGCPKNLCTERSPFPYMRDLALIQAGFRTGAGSRPLLCVGESGTPELINARVKRKKARKDQSTKSKENRHGPIG